MGMLGMGGAGVGGGALGMEMVDAAEGGGVFGKFWQSFRKNAWVAALLGAPLLLFSGIRTKLWAGALLLFKPFRWLGGNFANKKILSNPKNWRNLLVTGLVLSAAAAWDMAFDDETQGPHSDTFDNSDIDIDPGSPGGNWFTNMSMLDKAFLGWFGYGLVKGGLKTRVGQVLIGLMRTAWGSALRGSVGFMLMRAATAAGLFAGAVGAAVTWPVWVAVIAAGVAWWQWDNIMNFLAGESDEGVAQITTPTGLEKALYDASELKKFEPEFDTLESQTMVKAQEAKVANLIASARENAEYRDQIIQTLINGGWTDEDLKRLGQVASAKFDADGNIIPGTSQHFNAVGQNRFLNDLIDADGDLPLLNGDGPIVLSPVDQRRINNSVNKVITQHFYANEVIPFGWTGKQGFAPLGN